MLIYSHHVNVMEYNRGDLICGRALLTPDDYDYRRPIKNIETFYNARLSIIANSKNVIVYSVNMKQLNSLPETLQMSLREQLPQQREFDDLDLEQLVSTQENWQCLKQAYMKSIAIKKSLNKK